MKKQRNKKSIPVAVGDPIFVYLSVCCNERASKPALVKTPECDGTLGTWRCSKCGKVCKCSRVKFQKEQSNG